MLRAVSDGYRMRPYIADALRRGDAMPKLPRGEISKTDKGYRVSVGQYLGPDGKLRPRVFWLGHDYEVARYAAQVYRDTWHKVRHDGRLNWTPEDEAAAREFVICFRELGRVMSRQHATDLR